VYAGGPKFGSAWPGKPFDMGHDRPVETLPFPTSCYRAAFGGSKSNATNIRINSDQKLGTSR